MAKVGDDIGVPIGLDDTVQLGTLAMGEDATAFDLELTPIRTFVEVQSVPGVFTMRWKREGDSIKVRLIEQNAHQWRYAQMQEIKSFLENLLPETTILM